MKQYGRNTKEGKEKHQKSYRILVRVCLPILFLPTFRPPNSKALGETHNLKGVLEMTEHVMKTQKAIQPLFYRYIFLRAL